MALENSMDVSRASEVLINEATDVLIQRATVLIPIFKALGIAVLLYFIYIAVSLILRYKHRKRLKRVEEKLDLILDKLSVKQKVPLKKKIKKKNKKKK